MLRATSPVLIVAEGRWAQKIEDRIDFAEPVFGVPHPSRRGRNSYRVTEKDIERAFLSALKPILQAPANPSIKLPDPNAVSRFSQTGKRSRVLARSGRTRLNCPDLRRFLRVKLVTSACGPRTDGKAISSV